MIASALLLIGSIARAQDKASAAPNQHDMMRDDNGGMMGGDPAEMDRMMENCDRMMESWLQDHPQRPGTPSPPQPKG